MRVKKESLKYRFFNPSLFTIVVVYIATIILVAISIKNAIASDTSASAIVVYVLSFIILPYAIYLGVRLYPHVKERIIRFIKMSDTLSLMLDNYGYRTIVFTFFSFAATVIFVIYNIALAFIFHVGWYGALAGYYTFLSILSAHNLIRFKDSKYSQSSLIISLKTYRNDGILLCIAIAFIEVIIILVVSQGKSFSTTNMTMAIYVTALYAFIKMAISIANFVKARKQHDYIIRAIKNTNLAAALVSIFALQTSMLKQYAPEDAVRYVTIWNSATGGVVCAIILAMGIFMIVIGQKELNKFKIPKPKKQ